MIDGRHSTDRWGDATTIGQAGHPVLGRMSSVALDRQSASSVARQHMSVSKKTCRRLLVTTWVAFVALSSWLALAPRADASGLGGIEGTVTAAASKEALGGIEVCADTTVPPYIEACKATSETGDYTIGELPAGSYEVYFSVPSSSGLNYIGQAYPKPVSVAAGIVTPGIDAAMATGAEVTGKVTGEDTKGGIKGIEVCAYLVEEEYEGFYAQCGLTGASGEYAVAGLTSGEYKLQFFAPDGSGLNYLPLYYNGKSSLAEADVLQLTAGVTTGGIDATLAVGGEVSGRVTSATTKAAVAGIEVCAYPIEGGGGGCARTDASGAYTVAGLPTGSYHVRFEAPYESTLDYITQYYDGKTYSEADAVPVTVGVTTPNIDAAMQPGGTISGTVTGSPTKAGLEHVQVCAYGPEYRCASTGPSGEYTITSLPSGSYTVEFYGSGEYAQQYYNGKVSSSEADAVSVTAGSTTAEIGAEMQLGGTISGMVKSAATSLPLESVFVCRYPAHEEYFGTCTYTNAQGEYSFSGLAATEYKLAFSSNANYLTQYYHGKGSLVEAEPVAVAPGETKSEIDVAMQPGGEITGTATSTASKLPVAGATVTAYTTSGSYVTSATTNAKGEYALERLPSGSYKVGFNATEQNLVPQYYEAKSALGEAAAVSVTTGSTTFGIDAALQAGGGLSGTVTNAVTKAPLASAYVSVQSTSGSYEATGYTNTKGEYSVKGLAEGAYKVYFYASGFETQYYNGKRSLSEADPVSVTAGAVATGIGAAMQSLGSIEGTVTDAGSDSGISGVEVCADGQGEGYYESCVTTGTGGKYTITGLLAGTYKVGFFPGGEYLEQYYNGKASYEEANTITVGNEPVTGIDAALQTSGHVKGTVTSKAGGQSLGAIEVCAEPIGEGPFGGCAQTSSDGTYDISGLGTGSYHVEFIPEEGTETSNYLSQYYDGKSKYSEADPVAVTAGAATEEIDAALIEGGQIKGKITSLGSKTPLAHAGACAYAPEGEAYRCGDTNSEGEYTINGLPSGKYVVYFFPTEGEYAYQYYKEATSEAEATLVDVSTGVTTKGIDGQLPASGHITGTVTSFAAGKLLSGIEVCALSAKDALQSCTSSDANGEFSLAVSSGKHKVEFRSDSQSYETQYYDGKTSLEEADLVEIGEGATTGGIDAAMVSPGEITGRVTKEDGTTGLAGVQVCAFETGTPYTDRCGTTGSNGEYQLTDVPGGSYKVQFYAPQGLNYIEQYYSGKASEEEGESVTASPGTVTEHINAAMKAGGEIAGKVTATESGEAIAGIEVCPSEVTFTGYYGGCTTTDGSGEYTVEKLPTGEYRVGFEDPNSTLNYIRQYYHGRTHLSEADKLAITAGETTSGIDAALEPGGEISGKVIRIGTKAPLQNITVCPLEHGGYEEPAPCAQTNASGEYTLRGLPPGLVDVEFAPYGGEYFTQYYKETGYRSDATGVPVEVLHNTTGINAALKSTHPIVPELVSPPTISGTPQQGALLTEHHGEWTHEPTEYTYQWFSCNSLGLSCLPIEYAESQTYTPVAKDVGGTLVVQETAINVEGESEPAMSEPTAVVVPAKPLNLSPPEISGEARAGKSLSDHHGEWTNEPTEYGYQWERCDTNGENCIFPPHSTEQAYELSGADVGHTMRVIETAINPGGESEPAVSDASLVVVPEVPVDVKPPTITGPAVQGQLLSEHQGEWTNEPTSYAYQWERCSGGGSACQPIEGATYSTYKLTGEDIGHTLVVTETARNAGGPSQPAVSAATGVVVGAVPVNTLPPAISGEARQGGTLTEAHGYWTNEPTGYTYQWERCTAKGTECKPILGATEQTYVPEALDVGHELAVEEVAANETGPGKGVVSGRSEVIVSEVPVDVTLPTISGTARQGETLTEHHGEWANGPTRYEIEWQRCDAHGENCNTVTGGAEADEYQLTGEDLGHTIRVVETASNAGGPSEPAASEPTARVLAAVPVNVKPPTISGILVQNETLTEHHGEWTNQPSTYEYQWERCSSGGTECQPISGATGQTYVLTEADQGHRLLVVETASNAGGPSEPAASEPTAVVGLPVPVNTGPPKINGTARVGAMLTEEHGGWANEPTGYSYQWERCNALWLGCLPIEGATQQTYEPTAEDLGSTLVVQETARNATGPGGPAVSAPTAPVAPEPPVNTAPPTIAGKAVAGETLVLTEGTWSNGPTSYHEQWLRCDSGGSSCIPIHDAINPVYAPASGDVGHTLRDEEVASNTGGPGQPVQSQPTAVIQAAALQAVAGEPVQAVTGTPVTLNGSGSTPASEITGAHWDFGDGSSAQGETVQHAYSEAGSYTATLTVERGGETAKQSVAVTVIAAEKQATVTVEDENEQPLAGAEVLYIGAEGVRSEAFTDGAGHAKLAGLPDGTDTLYAVKLPGYKPAVGQVSVSGGEGEATVTLKSGTLGEAKLEEHEMNKEEIEAAGIDTSDPANQNTWAFEVGLGFSCHINSAGEFVGLEHCTGGGGGGGGGGGEWTSNGICSGETCISGGAVDEHPFIKKLVLGGTVTALKQFFSVKLLVYNVSPEPFKFTHGQATLTVPEGMSLAPTPTPQSASQAVADIPGEGSAETNWIIRGDQPGEYYLSASYNGRLEPFETPFELLAATDKPLKVWGAEAFGFHVEADEGSLKEGVPYHVKIGVYDKAPIPFYNVAINVSGALHEHFIYQPDQQLETSIGELKPGETIYAPQDILVPDADGGQFDPSKSFARFVGEEAHPGEGIEAVSPPPLYSMSASLESITLVHLHWQPSPGAEGYEVFSTPDLDTPFAADPDTVQTSATSKTTVTRLPASATDAYIPRGATEPPRFYAVTTLIDGQPRLEHPVREPSVQGPVGGPLTLRELLAGGDNQAEFCLQCAMKRITHADPVDAPTGNFWHSFTDVSVPGRGVPLNLARTYNSGAADTDGPFGYGWSFTYGMSLSFPDASHVVVNQENGAQVTFTEEPDGSYTAPPRVTATLVHNGDGTWTFVRHRRETFTFGGSGQLTQEMDLNGYVTSLAYNGAGQLETVTDPAGRKLTFAYEGGHISSVTDPLGRVVRYAYDAAGDLTDVTDVAGGDTHFTYDAEHRMLTMRTPDQAPGVPGSTGASVTNAYDSEGRVIEQTDQLGRTTKFAYSGEPLGEAGGTTTITDPKGNVTVQTYRFGELISETKGYGTPQAATWEFEYDQSTLGLISVTDPDGHTIKSTYDAEGNTLSTEDALGRKTVNTYDPLNDLLTSTDPMGVTTTNTYDAHGNLLSTSRPLVGTSEVQTTNYTYGDPSHPGDITAMTDPDGKTWEYTYDADGDRTSSTDPLGNKTTYTYNAIDWLMSSTSPRGNASGANPASFTTTYAHNQFGQVTETVDPLGHKTTNEYDPNQNLIVSTDADGNVTRYSYDAADEQTAVHRAYGTTTQTTYWPDGEVKEQIDGAGHVTRYEYDPLGRVVAVTDPLGRVTHYAYDPAGNETSMTDPEGQVTTKTYDADNELTSISYSDGKTPDVTAITYNADGERTSMTDGTGTSTFAYDSLNRMTSTDGSGATVKYAYDLDGHLTTLTYPNGKSVGRSYDAAGDLTGVTDWLGHTTHFSYDPDSNPTSYRYPNGVDTSFVYDSADRVSSIADTNGASTLAGFKYTRDADGDVNSEIADNGDESTENFAYDSLNQLTAENETPYGYDAADNPTTFGASTTQGFDAANELTSRTEPGEASEHPGEEGALKEKESPSTPESSSTTTGAPGTGSSSPGTTTTTPGGGVSGYHVSYTPPTKRTAVHATSTSGKLTSPKLRTRGSHELLLAFVSASGPASGGQRVAQLSGEGLHWSPVAHQAQAGGDAEIWQAHATHAVSGHVTARLRVSGYPATLAIETYSGSAYIEAHTTSHGHASAPAIELPGVDGALIVAVGNSGGQKGAIAPSPGQQMLTKYSSARGAGWVQQLQASSTSAHIADSHPAAQWGMAAVAIASHTAETARISRTSTARAFPTATDPVSPAISDTQTSVVNTGTSPSAASRSTIRRSDTTTGSLTREYSYNERGDRTGETANGTTLSLSYDQASRLIGVGNDISYTYNGDGLRMSKTVSGVTTQFAWSEAEELPQLLQDGSTYYIYGPEGVPIEQISGSTTLYLHQDQQGSTRLLTDGEGNVVGRYDYNAWGKVTSHTGSASTDLQYDGQYTDSETGYQYLRARYYDPGTGQFLTKDPAFAITRSPYGYTLDNPLLFQDPYGLFSWSHFLKVTAVVVGVVGIGAAVCVATAGLGCPAAIGVSAGTLTAVATGATVAGYGLDVASTAIDCRGGKSNSTSCHEDEGSIALDVVTGGRGYLIHSVVGDTYDLVTRALGLSYNFATSDSADNPQNADNTQGGSACSTPLSSSNNATQFLQPAVNGNSLQ
jgi:RHS repeat-associated protein